jgi:hypothetical protein
MKLTKEEKQLVINYIQSGEEVIKLILEKTPKTPMNWTKVLRLRNQRSLLQNLVATAIENEIDTSFLEKIIPY